MLTAGPCTKTGLRVRPAWGDLRRQSFLLWLNMVPADGGQPIKMAEVDHVLCPTGNRLFAFLTWPISSTVH